MSMRRKAESTEASISVENNVIGVAAGFQDPFTKTKVTAESALRAVPMGVPIDHAKILKTIEAKEKDFPTKTVEIVPAQVYEVIGYIIRMQEHTEKLQWVKIHSITQVPVTFVKDRVAREELRTCKEKLKVLLVAAEKTLQNGKSLYTYLKSFTQDHAKAQEFKKMHKPIQEAYEHCHNLVAIEAEAYRIVVKENRILEDKLEKDLYFRPRGWHAVKGENGEIHFLMSMKKGKKASGKRKPKTNMSKRTSDSTSEGVSIEGGKQKTTTKKPIEKFTLEEVVSAIDDNSVEEKHFASVRYWARKAFRKMSKGVDQMDGNEVKVYNYALGKACVCHLILGVVRPDLMRNGKGTLHAYAGMQFAGSLTPLVGTVVSSVVDAVFSALSVLASVATFAIVFSMVFTILYLIFEYTPDCVVNLVLWWNRLLGPLVQALFVAPLQLAGNIIRPLLAIYNLFVWVSYRVVRQVLVLGGIEQVSAVGQLAVATGNLIRHLSESVYYFLYAMVVDCDFDPNFVGDLCFEVAPREFDLITPMADVANMAKHFAVAVGGVCTASSALLDIVLYPLMDLKVARGVHGVGNSVLFTAFQLPVVTTKRCNRHRGLGVTMCLPDFEPSLNFLSSGLRDFGQGLDNWVNVAGAVVRKSVGEDVATCDSLSGGLTAAKYSSALFQGNAVAVVGLTELLYAVTDGVSAQYFSHSNRFESQISPAAWGQPVDPLLGVASVVYSEYVDDRDENGNPRTSMMGCRCVDDEASGEMQVHCAFALYGDAEFSPPPFRAVFSKASTGRYLTCKGVEISVQSVRWPVNRILSGSAKGLRGACQTRGTCTQVDAAVYVQPLCSSEGSPGRACIPTFQDSACYPFCLAVRKSNSGSEDLVLYDADQWKESVLVVGRDCAVDRQLASGELLKACVESGACGLELYDLPTDQVMTKLPKTFLSEWVVNRRWDSELGCVGADGAVSVIPQALVTEESSLRLPSVIGVDQPFSFAGDTTLTAVYNGDGSVQIRVERLYGDEKNSFSLTTVRKGFPAVSPDPDQTFDSEAILDQGGVEVPHVYSDMSGIRHPSVATQSSVFFATNPSLSMFRGFGSYCFTEGLKGKLQLSALSSYAGVRVHRIDPYTFCPNAGDNSEACADQTSKSVVVPGGYTEDPLAVAFHASTCDRKFTVAVRSMELVDDHNIVLTILNASLREFDLETGRLKEDATEYSYDLLYLNPATMGISDLPFVEQTVDALTVQGQLCPSLRVFPPLGSLATEAFVSVVEALRLPLVLATSMPGIIHQWTTGGACKMANHGHTLAQTCGEDIFLFSQFFDSLIRVNQIFWSVLGYVSGGMRKVAGDDVAELVDGVAYYGESRGIASGGVVGLAGIPKSVMIPIGGLGSTVTSAIFPMMPSAFTKATSGNPIKAAQFAWKLIARLVTRTIPVALQDVDVLRKLLVILLDTLNQGRDDFYQGVVLSAQGGCAGISLIVGYDNPWGRLARKACEASTLVGSGLYDLFLAIVMEVPVAKCMCVDARNSGDFVPYALDTCYPLVPTHMKPLVLSLIESANALAEPGEACSVLVEHAAQSVENSMEPFFQRSMDAAEELSSSFDYILTKFSDNAGRCLDFEDNVAGSIVLIAEPVDYFHACSLTSRCASKCAVELNAFKEAVDLYGVSEVTTEEEVAIEVPFFSQNNEDSFMPMNIVKVVELTGSIEGICATHSRLVGVVGVDYNTTISVKKYCVPTRAGLTTYQADEEAWWVWYSEEWSDTVVDIQFSDAEFGDSIVILRDGGGDENSFDETFVSVHARIMQSTPGVWAQYYWSSQDRMDRQLLVRASSSMGGWEGVAITDMLVQPHGMGPDILTVAAYLDVHEGSAQIVRRSVCASFSVSTEVDLVEIANGIPFSRCESMDLVFENIRLGYRPVMYEKGIWLVPNQKDMDLCRFPFTGTSLSAVGDKVVIPSRGKFGHRTMGATFQSWAQMSRGALSGMKDLLGTNSAVAGQSVRSSVGPTMAQNTYDGEASASLKFFVSGEPALNTHWLTMVSVSLSGGQVSEVSKRSSLTSSVQMSFTLQCNRESCLGCPSALLMNLCYALRQCAVVNCVGTPVSLKRPLCNVGFLAQNAMMQSIQMMYSAWMVFTETYRSILELSFGERSDFGMEWVDDSFFSYVCVAKDAGGEFSALFTSFFGAVVSKVQMTSYTDVGSGESVFVDTKASAKSSMIIAGATNMLFQMSLLPMYTMIVAQKISTCSASNIFAKVEDLGLLGDFTITIGRKDLSNASNAAVGQCLTSFFESQINERAGSMDKSSLATNMVDQVPTSGPNTVQKGIDALSFIASDSLTHQLRVLYHAMDGFISYTSGVVSGIQDMAQNLDDYHCRLPDYYMYKNLECGCSDTPVRIPVEARNSATRAYWCTGSLQLTDAFGKPSYVYNKYTYGQLAALVEAKAKAHLRCLSRLDGAETQCVWDPIEGLDDGSSMESQVSIAVLQKCRSNFLLKEWDAGAYHQFLGKGGTLGEVEQCILDAGENAAGPEECLLQHLLAEGVTKDDYFKYETTLSENVDACIVASGPAQSEDPDIADKFTPCVTSLEDCGDGANTQTCQLSPMIWEGSTANRVPVAYSHSVDEGDLRETAEKMLECARSRVLAELDELVGYSNGDSLDVVLFSAEGDALHQVMDCINMGPYSRVDFWSRGSDGTLPVPFWSRDAAGDGISRQLELPCNSGDDPVPPFTCGSQTRKRIIKNFVRTYVNAQDQGGDLVQKLVREKVTELLEAWSTPLAQLLCPAGGANCTEFLPDALNISFSSISGSHVLESVFDEIVPYMEQVYTENDGFAYQTAGDDGGLSTWDWGELQLSGMAKDSGLFDSTQPVVEYSDEEAAWPFKGGQSIWDMCTGLVGQVMFTMPLKLVNNQWTTSAAAKLLAQNYIFDYTVLQGAQSGDSGTKPLEDYVSTLLLDAFEHASTFWHYSIRHQPSDSAVCDGLDPDLLNGEVAFDLDGIVAGGEPVAFPLHGFQAHPLGGSNRSCMCGWEMQEGHMCVIPDGVCVASGLENCLYDVNGDRSEEEWVISYWKTDASPVVLCPETDLSDAWGFVVERHGLKDGGSYVDWKSLEGDQLGKRFSVSGEQLLEFSPGGLRLGSIDIIQEAASKAINPSAKKYSLRSDKGSVAIHRCGSAILQSINTDDFVEDVIQDLFPASQGIKEAAPVSVCLRFSIEFLRQRLLQVMQANGVPNLDERILKQGTAVDMWRSKCSVQLDMLGVCNSAKVFNIIPKRKRAHKCPFTVSAADEEYYTTSGCLVFSASDDAFYDPCRSKAMPDLCSEQALTLNTLTSECPDCRVPFDVRATGIDEALGVFPIHFMSGNETHDEEMAVLSSLLRAERVEGRSGDFPYRLTPGLAEHVVSGGSSVGNVQADQSWWNAEGFANESSLHCDGIQDWWPSGWMPTGYHVTLPCSDAAHRTFDAAFAVRADEEGQTYMVFHSMLLRNQTTLANNYGVGGFCRRGNYGMPLHVTNLMRVCTRDASNVAYDPSVPIQPAWDGSYGEEHCSTSAFETPWNIEDLQQGTMHPGMFSVGHVPFFFSDTNAYYPQYTSQVRFVRPGVNDTTWSDDCGTDPIFECEVDDDCVLIVTDAQLQSRTKCFRRTCIILEDGACFEHAHCEGNNTMCSGEGTCEPFSWQVHNQLEGDVDFDMFTTNCSSLDESMVVRYDKWGASAWHDIPDVLHFYGFCSYRSWFEYLRFVGETSVSEVMFGLSAMTKAWPDTGIAFDLPALESLWHKGKFRVRASPCDRDYMHLDGVKGCSPVLSQDDELVTGVFEVLNGHVLRSDPEGDKVRGEYARTFYTTGEDKKVMMSQSTSFKDEKKVGFLSQKDAEWDSRGNAKFQYCREGLQCPLDAMANTYQGQAWSLRQVYADGGVRDWTWDDTKKCGVFGISTVGGCALDVTILPLYQVLCKDQNGICGLTPGDISAHCKSIDDKYGEINQDGLTWAEKQTLLRDTAALLNDLWKQVALSAGGSTKTATYVAKMDCSVQLYQEFDRLRCNDLDSPFCTSYHVANSDKVTGGYYVSTNTFREFPLLWFFKCCLMEGKSLDEASGFCDAWENRVGVDLLDPEDVQSYSQLLRYDAGITTADLLEARGTLVDNVKWFMAQLADPQIKWEAFFQGGWNTMYPQCRAHVIYSSDPQCVKDVLNLALGVLATPNPACTGFQNANSAQDSSLDLLRTHVVRLLVGDNVQAKIKSIDFLDALGNNGQSLLGLNSSTFQWDQKTFPNIPLKNALGTWSFPLDDSAQASLPPRLTVEKAQTIIGDPNYLKCSQYTIQKYVATTAHCDAVHDFLQISINALTGADTDWDEAKGYLAFDWVDPNNIAKQRMQAENAQARDACYTRVSQSRLQCVAPPGFDESFCESPQNARAQFLRASASKQGSTTTFQPIPFAMFCTVWQRFSVLEGAGGHWGCSPTPGYTSFEDGMKFSRDHVQRAVDAKGTMSALTRDNFLNAVLQRIVQWEGTYSGDDFFFRRVFYSNHDGKHAWRFLAQAYKGTFDNNKRSTTDFCDYDAVEGKSMLLGTGKECTTPPLGRNAKILRPYAIAESDADFVLKMASAFKQSFVDEMYKFQGSPSDIVGCYNTIDANYRTNFITKNIHYATDGHFRLKEASGACTWEGGESTSAVLGTAYTKLQELASTLYGGKLSARAPLPKALAFHQGGASWEMEGGLDLVSLTEFEDLIGRLGITYDCAQAEPITHGVCNQSTAYLEAAENYKSHVVMEGGPRVPSKRVLFWGGMGFHHGIAATLPTWSLNKRDTRKQFAKWVMDPVQTCKLSNHYNSVCWLDASQNKFPVSPLLTGDFNVFSLCDTAMSSPLNSESVSQEVVDVSCHPDVCNDEDKDYVDNLPDNTCQDGARPGHPNVPRTVDRYDESGNLITVASRFERYNNNLCAQQPVPLSTCDHPQGMLGGRLGRKLREDLPREHALYEVEPHHIEGTQKDRALFLGGGNPLFWDGDRVVSSSDANRGFLSTSPREIGGTHVVLNISMGEGGDPVMYVDKTPLACPGCGNDPARRVENSMKSAKTHGLVGWLRNLESSMALEQDLVNRLYPTPTSKNRWSCPLRRVAFYTRAVDDPNFSPLVPNPLRAARLFNDVEGLGSMNFGTRSHPTQLFATMQRTPNVVTPNGFCMCAYVGIEVDSYSELCQFLSSDPNCGYQATVLSIRDKAWRNWTVQTLGVKSKCTQAVDWPYEPGVMRDGTTKDVGTDRGICDLTPRLPKFQFRYLNSGDVQRLDTTTNDAGGACHMAVPGGWEDDTYKAVEKRLCTRVNETDANITVSCVVNGVPSTYVLPRKEVRAPHWAAEAMRTERRRCDTCDALPKWEYVLKDDSVKELPRPEVSYGIPFRWSSARLLAASAKAAICGGMHNQTDACLNLLKRENWKGDEFMKLFTEGGVEQLLAGSFTNRTPGLLESLSEPMVYSEDDLWNASGWVACTQEVKSTCYGTIPKHVWESRSRPQACLSEYAKWAKSGQVEDNAVGLDVCTIDNRLNELCRVLQQAKQKVVDANCIYSGQCSRSMFVYSPGFYSIDNLEFSRATVINYYEYYAGTPDVCPADDEEVQLRIRNNQLLVHCASTQLEAIQLGLRVARQVVHVIIKSLYIYTQLVVSLAKLLVSSILTKVDEVNREIEFWFQQLINVIFDAVETIGNLLFKMVFETGGFGQVFAEILDIICKIIEWLVANVWNKWTCPMLKHIVAPILETLINIIHGILSIFFIDTGTFFEKMYNITAALGSMECDLQFKCMDLDNSDQQVPKGALPVSSRCFVDYIPAVDEPSPFSCTRSDTCAKSSFSYGAMDAGTDHVDVCDACPLTDPDILNQYGCDTYTQQCTCGAQKQTRTYCMNNAECQLPDATCALVRDYTTGASYGGTQCSVCSTSTPVCLRKGTGPGTCSCLLQRPVNMQVCALGELPPYPDPSALCGVASQSLGRSSKYEIAWGQLGVAPCAVLGLSNIFCVKAGGYGNIAVGIPPSGRRLLEDWNDRGDLPRPEYESWDHVASPCRILVQAQRGNRSLSVTEELTLEWCYERRDWTNFTIKELNLTRFQGGDHFLLSFYDFADVLARRGALHQLLFEAPLFKFWTKHSKVFNSLRRLVEGIIASALMPENAYSGVHNHSRAEKSTEAQVTAFKAMFATTNVTTSRTATYNNTGFNKTTSRTATYNHTGFNKTTSRTATYNNTGFDKARHNNTGFDKASHNDTNLNSTARKLLAIEDYDPRLHKLSDLLEIIRQVPRFLKGDFQFPPKTMSDSGEQCSAGSAILESMVDAGLILVQFFKEYTPDPALGSWEFNLPSWNSTGGTGTRTATGSIFYDIIINDFMSPYIGINAQAMINFFSTSDDMPDDAFTLKNVVSDGISCDFEELMLCKNPRRRLLTAIIMAAATLALASYVTGQMGWGLPVWFLLPLVTLWFAYGTSPRCAPMLPTCLWVDLIDTLNAIAPSKFYYPVALQKFPGCLPTKNMALLASPPPEWSHIEVNTGKCLVPCSDLAFDGYLATLAWAACWAQPDMCEEWELPIIGGLNVYTKKFGPIIRTQSLSDRRDASAYCFFTTLPSAVPYLMAATAVTILTLCFAKVPFKILAAALHPLVHAVCYSHVQAATVRQ